MSAVFKFIASLRLTLVLLVLSLVLVFLGTMAQEPLGLYLAQSRFFHSALVDYASMAAAVKKSLQMVLIYLPPSTAADVLMARPIPVYPGGYLLGSLLLINLLAAHAMRFKFTRKKTGIFMVHAGIILLLVGQLLTDLVARESAMRLSEGQTLSYAESDRRHELVFVDSSAPDRDAVVSIPDVLLREGAILSHPSLPFQVRVRSSYSNSELVERGPSGSNAPPSEFRGLGGRYLARPVPNVTQMDLRDFPSAVVDLVSPAGDSLGSWLVSGLFYSGETRRPIPQTVETGGRRWELTMRLRRYYKDFSLTLLDFRHDKYTGTEIPKNFSSKVRLQNPRTGEDREVLIYMNNPLRYQGETFYQASFDPQDDRVTILQVVRNPAWLTPYFACLIVGAGLLVQFGIHLFGFMRRQPQPRAVAQA